MPQTDEEGVGQVAEAAAGVGQAVAGIAGTIVGGGAAPAGAGPSEVDSVLSFAEAMGITDPKIIAAIKAGELTMFDLIGMISQDEPSAGVNPDKVRALRIYTEIWGHSPPGDWYKGVKGLNDYEIAAHELAKPEAKGTAFYRDRWAGWAQQLSELFGRRTG